MTFRLPMPWGSRRTLPYPRSQSRVATASRTSLKHLSIHLRLWMAAPCSPLRPPTAPHNLQSSLWLPTVPCSPLRPPTALDGPLRPTDSPGWTDTTFYGRPRPSTARFARTLQMPHYNFRYLPESTRTSSRTLVEPSCWLDWFRICLAKLVSNFRNCCCKWNYVLAPLHYSVFPNKKTHPMITLHFQP